VRALIPLGQLTILLGTITTASGPHPGAHDGQIVKRFTFEGTGTLHWMVERHGAIAAFFGIAALGVLALLMRRGGERRAVRPLVVTIGLLGLQGALGIVQYQAKLPAELVWVHIALATITWVAMLWTVASAGRIQPRSELSRKLDEALPAATAPAG
jgi:cytochrome c oxidase assembly protein subunit 15